MAKPFDELRERLLRAGVAPRHVRRCLAELSEHFADLVSEEERAGRDRTGAEAAALARIGGIDDLARAITAQSQLRSWSVRAPWAIFGVAPFFLLAAFYFAACLILWSGWTFFLPGADTPFVRLDGLAVLYFGFGKSIYFGGPVLVGWGMAWIAARQRLQLIWPAATIFLIALIASAAHIHVHRPSGLAGPAAIGMTFSFGPFLQNSIHVLAILTAVMLPYLVWRLENGRRSGRLAGI